MASSNGWTKVSFLGRELRGPIGKERSIVGKADRAYRYLTKAFVFVVILVVVLWGINSFLQPVWYYENNYHTYRTFYDEPRDTIETVFVGASMTIFGYSPMEMYAQDGICAYNLASTSQPVMMSYYWVKEAHRLQSGSLDTVVMDVSMLRRKSTESDYRKALDGMEKSSPIKKEAIEDITNDTIDALYYQFPILGYHDRWASLDYTDFVKYEDNLEDYARGYYMDFVRVFDFTDVQDIPIPAQIIDPEAASSSFENFTICLLVKRERREGGGREMRMTTNTSPSQTVLRNRRTIGLAS